VAIFLIFPPFLSCLVLALQEEIEGYDNEGGAAAGDPVATPVTTLYAIDNKFLNQDIL
jgi:hypothetical protein